MDTVIAYWDYLREIGVSEETLRVVTDICGYSEETMEAILYSVTGYHSLSQILEEEEDEEEI